MPGGRPTKQQAEVIRQRREEVARYLAQGLPQVAIAKVLGCTIRMVHEDAKIIIADRRATMDEYADQIIARQTAELEMIREKAWHIVRAKHFHVTRDGTLAVDQDGNPLIDPTPNISAMNLLLKTQEREARLMGTDQPKRLNINAQVITLDVLKASVLAMREQARELEG